MLQEVCAAILCNPVPTVVGWHVLQPVQSVYANPDNVANNPIATIEIMLNNNFFIVTPFCFDWLYFKFD